MKRHTSILILLFTAALAFAPVLGAKEKNMAKGARPVEVVAPPSEINRAELAKVNVRDAAAKIDELVEKKLAEQKIKPNAVVNDEIFVRRAYLDIIGRVPTKAEALAFLNSKDAGKRPKLINELLKSDGYVDHFFNFWADLLRVKSNITNNGLAAGHAYIDWIKNSLRRNKPYDQMVRELLTANGVSYENGAVGFYMRDYNMPLDNMAVTTQIFLGTQMVCAQCHNHPFDKWTQKDYYEIAAHTYGMTGSNVFANQGEVSRALARTVSGADERRDVQKAFTEILFQLRFNHTYAYDRAIRLPKDYKYPDAKPNEVIEPVIPASFTKDGKLSKDGEPPVEAYSSWVTSPKNPRFTVVIANRLWKKVMGMGVIEPVDELTDSTVPSNPALMEFLEQTMKDVGYDMKAFVRVLMNTKAYQRETYTKDVDAGTPYYFQGPLLRRMTAEQIWDSMVALSKENPDEPSRALRLETQQLLTKIEWMDRTLNNQTPEELVEGAKKIAAYQKELVQEIKAGGGKANAKNQRKLIFDKVGEIVFNNGFQKFAAEVSQGTRKLAAETDKDFARQVVDAVHHYNRVPTMEEALDFVRSQQVKDYNAWLKAQHERELMDWGVTTKERRKSYESFAQYRDKYLQRASELRLPAPNGHFLRQFGQSDRELVDNGNHEASVMQSLTMMNGSLFRNLVNPFSVIGREMRQAGSPDEIIDTIYLSTLTRHATPAEKEMLRPIMMAGSRIEGAGDALWTVLNTRQFLFIQ